MVSYWPCIIWSFQAKKEAAQAHLSLHLSKCHIVGNLMSRLICLTHVLSIYCKIIFTCTCCNIQIIFFQCYCIFLLQSATSVAFLGQMSELRCSSQKKKTPLHFVCLNEAFYLLFSTLYESNCVQLK